MKLFGLICAGILLVSTGKLYAQEGDWNDIGVQNIISNDTFTHKGFTLVFINKQPGFDTSVRRQLIETFFTVYPKEVKMYNPKSLRKVIFIIDTAYKGVAATSGSIVRYNPDWFVTHPTDIDVVTHEVMHIVQSYTNGDNPGWLVEGIADYVRNQMGVNNKNANWALPNFSPKQHYTDAYRVTAKFLVWATNKYNPKLVQRMDAAMRSGTYRPELWKTLTGSTVDELWKAYASTPLFNL